jgi:hypothetical protein
MLDYDIKKLVFKESNSIKYNDFISPNRYFGNLFTVYNQSISNIKGVSWLSVEASIVSTLIKLLYYFKQINNLKGTYLVINPILKKYIYKNNKQLKDELLIFSRRISLKTVNSIDINKVVILGEDNTTCMLIEVFDIKDIHKLRE